MSCFVYSSGGSGATVAIVIFSLIGVAIVAGLVYYCYFKKKKTAETPEPHVKMGQSILMTVLYNSSGCTSSMYTH